ncbi:MAG: AAA family ATPase [Acidimicrobiia bacterium]
MAGRYEPNPAVTFTRDQPADAHPGGAWILDQPTRIAALWGTGDEVAWSQGETLIVVGSDGTGKTVLAQNLITRMIGLDTTPLLGLTVTQRLRVLYLAQDRPRQSARAFQRLVGTADRARARNGTSRPARSGHRGHRTAGEGQCGSSIPPSPRAF